MLLKGLFRLLSFLTLLISATGQRKKKHNQEILFRSENDIPTSDTSQTTTKGSDTTIDINGDGISQVPNLNKNIKSQNTEDLSDSCSPCVGVDRKGVYLYTALKHFWKQSYTLADDCLCHSFSSKQDDTLAKALSVSLQSTPNYRKKGKVVQIPKGEMRTTVKNWEVLGPINVGKLELDGDPTFMSFQSLSSKDMASFILGMDDNQTISSELLSEAKATWKKYTAKANGQVDVHYNLPWNEIAQGLASTSVYEWQGWARATTFVPTSGSYMIDCQGPHSLYIWNDHKTHLLSADVYRAQKLRTSLELKAGIVGIVIPIRAVVQAQFLFSIQPIPDHVQVYSPQQVPHLLELSNKRGYGMLVSGVFLLPVQNVFSTSVTLSFAVETPIDEEDTFHIREAKRYTEDHNSILPISIAPGQTIALPLELIRETPLLNKHHNQQNGNNNSDAEEDDHDEEDHHHDTIAFLRCSENNRRIFQIIVSSSRGASVQIPLDLECRRWDQSFHVSYLSHDDSVAQAAVILPLDVHSPSHHRKLQMAAASDSSSSSSRSRGNVKKAAAATRTSNEEGGSVTYGDDFAHAHADIVDGYSGYPVLLTYHGSGIAAQNHADAYKLMPSHMKEYLFGVTGYYVISPSRFGAHNWEGVGEYTGREALFAIAHLFNFHFAKYLPTISIYHGIISGHSMGGHGAWVTATNAPDHFSCAAPTAGWITKSEYSNSNDFFQLDIASTYTPIPLKRMLEQCLSEYHVDSLVANLRTQDVHIRVGTHDMTTPAWYSRRMYRLLREEQHHLQLRLGATTWANVSLEEVTGKQHWWWDTAQDNDGGVLNDQKMRQFYQSCHVRALEGVMKVRKAQQFIRNDLHQVESDKLENDKRTQSADGSAADSVSGSATSAPAVSVSTSTISGKDETALKENADIFAKSSLSAAAAEFNKLQEYTSTLSSLPCHRNLSLTLVNPAIHAGLCGTRVLQQTKQLERSQVDVSCHYHIAAKGLSSSSSSSISSNSLSRIIKTCTMRAQNIRRLAIQLKESALNKQHSAHNIWHDADYLIVKPASPRLGMGSETVKLDLRTFRNSSNMNSDDQSSSFLHLCFAPYAFPLAFTGSGGIPSIFPAAKVCDQQIVHPLQEKHLVNYGPMRRVYDRLFYIVYGTPPNQALRQSMRDFAVYLANAHYVAHNTLVPILSDVEFKTAHINKRRVLPNIIFIGDTTTNKLLKTIIASTNTNSMNKNANSDVFDVSGILPGNVTFDYRETVMNNHNVEEFDDDYMDSMSSSNSRKGNSKTNSQKKETFSFSIHNRIFDQPDQAIAFTLPLLRTPAAATAAIPDVSSTNAKYTSSSSSSPGRNGDNSKQKKAKREHSWHRPIIEEDIGANDTGMGLVLHGNSVEAYRHLSRLAWPVIPPMVRAPFALYLPDFVVIDETIWSHGPGGLLAAGFWDNQWRHDPAQSYWR